MPTREGKTRTRTKGRAEGKTRGKTWTLTIQADTASAEAALDRVTKKMEHIIALAPKVRAALRLTK